MVARQTRRPPEQRDGTSPSPTPHCSLRVRNPAPGVEPSIPQDIRARRRRRAVPRARPPRRAGRCLAAAGLGRTQHRQGSRLTTPLNLSWRLVERSGLRRGLATEPVDDLPGDLKPRHVYLVGDGPRPWSAAMLCPCGCGATIQLSLVPHDSPSWRATRNLSGSVSPSLPCLP